MNSMNVKRTILSLICLIPFTMMAQVHDKLSDSLISRFGKYRESALQEKIYAHVDRNVYLTGETLWFKIYTVDGSTHKPMHISKVAYAEVLDRGDFPVLQAKIELNNGGGSGAFFLPASLSSGNYRLRIYTSWMKNYSAEFYFNKTFTIVNPFVVPEASKELGASTPTVSFFPEGGNLVAGIESKVAFRITDRTGKGNNGNGYILNEENDTLAVFRSAKFGMGHFFFTPSEGQKYSAMLVDADGRTSRHDLPEMHASGFVMQLRDSGEVVHVSVKSRQASAAHVYLFVHARQMITHAEKQSLQRNGASFVLSKSELAEGISHLTLFSDDLQPVCERLFFTYPKEKLEIDIASNQKVFAPRKKVSIKLQTNVSGAPVSASVSMAVYKLDSLSTITGLRIFPYLWLQSDLTGEIESPEYYFPADGPPDREAMDHLMLTHGWRRFDWNDILKGATAVEYLPEVRGHIITGLITKDQQKQRGVFAYLGSPGKIIRAYGSWSNNEGKVRFEIKDFYGQRRIIVQTKTDSADRYDIAIIDPFSESFKKEKLPEWRPDKAHANALLSRSIAMQVQDIYYYERFGSSVIEPEVDSSAFYGKADNTYYLDDYTRFPVMEEVMREYVPAVFVRKRKDGFHFLVIDQVNGGVLSGDPLILLDGVPILNVDDIMRLDPLLVRKLDIIKSHYFLGQASFSGIVSYSTYSGDLAGMEFNPGSISLDYEGLQLKRRFHSPKYSRHQEDDRMPDQRYLLHWEPDVTTIPDDPQAIEFFTSDVPGTYLVVVEGLDAEGHAGTKTYTFTVTPPDTP